MALSTRESASSVQGGLTSPSETSPPEEVREQSPRSNEATSIGGSSSLWRDAWRRLLRNKLAVAGGIVVIALVLIAVSADVLAPYSYT